MPFLHNSRLVGYGVVLVFWTIVGFGEFPAPFVDDAIFIGAALNLVQHNIFSNPLCESLSYFGSSTYFFSAMPLHSYVLAAWLEFFGISAFSFHLFSTLAALGVTLGIYRFFPAGPFLWFYALFCSLAVFGLLGGTGLRMEGLALLFLVLGLGVCRARGIAAFFLGNLFLALTVITHPGLGLIALLVSGGVLLYRYVSGIREKEFLHLSIALAAAYALAFLLFLWCIDGELGEFVTGMMTNQRLAATDLAERFHLFSTYGLAKWVVVQGSFLLLLAVLAQRWRKAPDRGASLFLLGVVAIGYLLLAMTSFTSATACHLWAFACLIVSLWLVARENWGTGALLAWTFVFIIAIYGHGHIVVEDCLADRPGHARQKEEILAQLAEMHPDRIYADTYAMREIYDYRFPDNVRSCEGSWPFDRNSFSGVGVAVVSVKDPMNLLLGTQAQEQPRPLVFLGHSLNGVYKNPYDLVIIDIRFQ